jgi:hypothetical protein
MDALAEGSELDDSGPTTVRRLHQPNKRLSGAEVQQIVSGYTSGATIRSLALLHGVHEQTVRAHLRVAGVVLRPTRSLDAEQTDEACVLYAQGWSLARIGEKFDVGDSGVGNAMRRAGVELRAPGFGWRSGDD